MPVPADPPARDHGARPAGPGRPPVAPPPVAPPTAGSRRPVLGTVLPALLMPGGEGASGDPAPAVAPPGLVTPLVPTAPESFTAPYAVPARPCS
ncbi:hypothetical protein ACFWVP_11845 [Streptomyces sp. NPDC058637]|uniref:hypothetical protein n=1 Tax=Streptomyces sp. NPDC058637 TaxID=3346569 RepID=UPI00365F747C